MKKKQQLQRSECAYHRMWNFFNHGGARPCMSCDACEEDYKRLEQLKQWVRNTRNGADPRR